MATQLWKKYEDMCNRFDRISACDGQTDGQTSWTIYSSDVEPTDDPETVNVSISRM